jgi:hypothetical protein
MIIKEIKFIGILLFIIFAILLLVALVFFITYQRFQCSEHINYMKTMKFYGKIEDVLPYLQTGDIIIAVNCTKEKISKYNCFKSSRGNFVKNGYNYSHITMIYRKNNKIYLIDFSFGNRCMKKYYLVDPRYKDGLRIIEFEKYIKELKVNTKKDDFCCQNYGIRFINRNINQEDLNRRLENEINIISDKNFNNYNNVAFIAASGWLLKDMPNNFNYSTEIFYPNDKKDTYFCSEMIGLLLQRIGVMKRENRARMFYPADYAGSLDDRIFEKGMYSNIKIYI